VRKCIPRVERLEIDDPCSKPRNWVFWNLKDVGRVWSQGKMKDGRVQCHLLHGISKVGKRCELSGR